MNSDKQNFVPSYGNIRENALFWIASKLQKDVRDYEIEKLWGCYKKNSDSVLEKLIQPDQGLIFSIEWEPLRWNLPNAISYYAERFTKKEIYLFRDVYKHSSEHAIKLINFLDSCNQEIVHYYKQFDDLSASFLLSNNDKELKEYQSFHKIAQALINGHKIPKTNFNKIKGDIHGREAIYSLMDNILKQERI